MKETGGGHASQHSRMERKSLRVGLLTEETDDDSYPDFDRNRVRDRVRGGRYILALSLAIGGRVQLASSIRSRLSERCVLDGRDPRRPPLHTVRSWALLLHLDTCGSAIALFGLPLGVGVSTLASEVRSELRDLLARPAVPQDGDKATDGHEHGKIPERVVAETGAGARNDEDAGQPVLDGLVRELPWKLVEGAYYTCMVALILRT